MSSGVTGSIPNTSCGGCLNVTVISVAVTGMALARPDQDRHPGPAPGIGGEPDRDVRLHGRIRVDAVHLAVALVLAAHRVLRGQRAQRVHHLLLGVPPGGKTVRARRFGQDGRQHLEHVVLQHVPDGAGPVVEPAAVGDVERLGHGDLDVLHVGPVEQRLDHRVGEPDEQHVLHRVEGQPVVDPEDRLLREVLVHGVVELPRAGQVDAERLLHHHPRVLRAGRPWRFPARSARTAGPAPPCSTGPSGPRRSDPTWPCRWPRRRGPRPRTAAGRASSTAAASVRVHVVELQRGDGVVAELLQPPAALGHPDHRDVEHAALDQPHQRGEGLDLGQVPGGTEDHQRVNFVGHVIPPDQSLRSHRARAQLASPAAGDPAQLPGRTGGAVGRGVGSGAGTAPGDGAGGWNSCLLTRRRKT